MIVQAGSSENGKNLAAAHADLHFSLVRSIEEGQQYRADMDERLRRVGRSPDRFKILPGIVPIIAESAAEAREKQALLETLMPMRIGSLGDFWRFATNSEENRRRREINAQPIHSSTTLRFRYEQLESVVGMEGNVPLRASRLAAARRGIRIHGTWFRQVGPGTWRIRGHPAGDRSAFAHFMAWSTIAVEILGGLAVLLGAFVALASLPMAAVVVVAMFTVHARYGFSSIKLMAVTAAGPRFGPPGVETNLFYLACLAVLAIGGSGPLAIDALIRRGEKQKICRQN
jgi:uncharacterized membrane protein YphA (DoxX/SURF4 family)